MIWRNYRDDTGMMEKKMETTTGNRVYIVYCVHDAWSPVVSSCVAPSASCARQTFRWPFAVDLKTAPR